VHLLGILFCAIISPQNDQFLLC